MSFQRPTPEQIAAAQPGELAQLAADCLARLEPGMQPLPLFTQLARLVRISTFEFVPILADAEGPTVLLSQRDANDPWWADLWHVPGSVLPPAPANTPFGKEDYGPSADKLLIKEFGGSVVRQGDLQLFDAHPRYEARGSEQTVFLWGRVALAEGFDAPTGGQFMSIDDALELPVDAFITGHQETVRQAASSLRDTH